MKCIKHFVITCFCMAAVFFSNQVAAQVKAGTVTQGTYKTIFEMLQTVPGLEVTTSTGRSGGSVTIRGTGSLTSKQAPLIVVDGAIYKGDMSNINPQDVDDITVLKDAASATAYGSQGAAGVILITTKTGSGVKNTTTFAASHTESAYTYFIEHKTTLRVFGLSDEVLVEGVIAKQQDSTLVFIKRRKEILIPVSKIKRVEMMPADN